jgi:2-polyprenyl-3-methyl-5-hydroxy-6-metoxy-1,4-benzoquinol methylase
VNKVQSFLLVSLSFASSLFGWTKEDFAYENEWSYQDLLIEGETIFKGYGANCPARYETLRPLLNQFKRPITVLEIGADNGYFSFQIAKDYDATCVMIDSSNRLKKIYEANFSLKNIVYLQKLVDATDLNQLAKTEHFDVVLCFHVLHGFVAQFPSSSIAA